MTVQTNNNSITYVGNGSTVHFDYDYLILNASHLKVYFGDVLQTSGYEVSGVSSQTGGTVAFAVAPPNGANITLIRDVPFLQLTDYQPYDAFPAESHERALDLLTMMTQQLKDELGRTMQYPVGGNKWDAKDNEIINVGTGSSGTSAANINQVKYLIASEVGNDPSASASVRSREALRRSYAEAGYNLVDGSFEAGGTLVNANDVLLQERTGKAFSGSAGPVSAGTNPAIGGFVDRSGELLRQQVVGMSYAQLRAYTGMATVVAVGCRTAVGDGGDGLFYFDAADTTSADNDFTTLVTATGKRWKRAYSGSKMLTWAGVKPGTDVTSALQNAINVGGGELLIKDGVYSSGKVTIDGTGLYPSLGNPSTRFDLVGSSLGNTIFKVSNSFLEYIGYDGASTASQGIHTGMTIKEFSVVGTGNVGYGIRIKNAAYAHISKLYFKDLEIGMRLSGALTSYYNQIHAERNNYGVLIEPNSYSNVNAVRFSGIFHNNSKAGIGGIVGANVCIEDSNFEGCGTDGVSVTGGIILECNERMSTININAYFEGNVGDADIKINNPTASTLIVNLRGCSFIRGNSDGAGCLSNIDLPSSGGGQIILNLMGCSFYTKTSDGYVPSVNKPFIKPYPHLIVNGEETCFFNESTSRANTGNSGGVLGLTMKADGTCVNAPLYLQPRRDSVGVYILDRLYSYSYNVDHLQVVAVSRTSGAQLHYITKLTPSAIRFKFVDFTGAPMDTDFDVMITARK